MTPGKVYGLQKIVSKIFDSRKILKIHNFFFIEEKILKDWATLKVEIKDGARHP